MLIAAAAKAVTEPHWWDDWLKFTPGWLAFLWVIGNAAWKGLWVRRHHLALGPEDDALRDILKQLRDAFEVMAQGQYWEWEQHWRSRGREIGREVREHAERRKDKRLTTSLGKAADAMDEVIASQPAELGVWAELGDDPSTADERAELAEHEAKQDEQKAAARVGLEHVGSALTRLNKLERRIFGRS